MCRCLVVFLQLSSTPRGSAGPDVALWLVVCRNRKVRTGGGVGVQRTEPVTMMPDTEMTTALREAMGLIRAVPDRGRLEEPVCVDGAVIYLERVFSGKRKRSKIGIKLHFRRH